MESSNKRNPMHTTSAEVQAATASLQSTHCVSDGVASISSPAAKPSPVIAAAGAQEKAKHVAEVIPFSPSHVFLTAETAIARAEPGNPPA